jgi:tetraacyldisaccharide 4'-kinase
MDLLRILLIPISLLYQLVLNIRHLLYDIGIFRSKTFDFPTICVGNLSFGGTGKTPHIEYLVKLLQNDYRLAILSRGYKRKTKGFVLATDVSTFETIGDEPLQYAKKFKDIDVGVDANRNAGIAKLRALKPQPEIILLDDAFQHRQINAGLKILLTDFHNLYPNDFLFPAGSLRDTMRASKRADIIVVTKTPKVFSPFTRRRLTEIINPRPGQSLHFSYLKYGNMVPVFKNNKIYTPRTVSNILLFCGIANPYPLQEHLYTQCNNLIMMKFNDHHVFTKKDIAKIIAAFDDIFSKNKIMVTTEKDAMRLIDSPYFSQLKNLPLFYVPVVVEFHESKGQQFDNQVIEYVRENQGDNCLPQ